MPLFLLSFARAAVRWEKGQWAYRRHRKYGWRKKGSFEGGPTGSQGLQGLRKRGFKEGCQFFWLPGKCCDHPMTQGTHEKHQVGEDFSCGHGEFPMPVRLPVEWKADVYLKGNNETGDYLHILLSSWSAAHILGGISY